MYDEKLKREVLERFLNGLKWSQKHKFGHAMTVEEVTVLADHLQPAETPALSEVEHLRMVVSAALEALGDNDDSGAYLILKTANDQALGNG